MTVAATTAFSGPFTPNGSTTAFPFTFISASAAEVLVGRLSSSGVFTALGGYTVARNSDGTGTVNFSVAPAAGDPIYILSNPSFQQQVSFANQGSWSPKSLNGALDAADIRAIYLKGLIDRTFKVPLGETAPSFLSATARAGYYLAFDLGGNPIADISVAGMAALRSTVSANTVAIASLGTAIAGVALNASGINVPRVTPELYGAVGDGVHDDGPALAAAGAVITGLGGGALDLYPGRTYWVGSQTLNGTSPPQTGDAVYTFAPTTPNSIDIGGCTKPVVINGNGARIKCLSGKKYGAFNEDGSARSDGNGFTGAPGVVGRNIATPYAAMLRIHDCTGPIIVTGLELDGNIGAAIIGGQFGDTGRQIPMTGLLLADNGGPVDVDGVNSHHHGQDGIAIIGPGLVNVRENGLVRSSRFANNGRQGMSLTAGNGWAFKSCKFSSSGKSIGSMPYTPPGAGADLEAEGGRWVKNITFDDCDFVDNSGVGFLSDTNTSVKGVVSRRCTFVGTTQWSIWPCNPQFVFEDCTIVGAFTRAYPNTDANLATKFKRCLITDDVTLSPTGQTYGGGGGYLLFDVGGGETNITFDECTWLGTRTTTGAGFTGNTGNYAANAGMHHHNCTFKKDPASPANYIISGIISGEWTHFINVDGFPAGGASPYGWAYDSGDALDSYLLEHAGRSISLTRLPATASR